MVWCYFNFQSEKSSLDFDTIYQIVGSFIQLLAPSLLCELTTTTVDRLHLNYGICLRSLLIGLEYWEYMQHYYISLWQFLL